MYTHTYIKYGKLAKIYLYPPTGCDVNIQHLLYRIFKPPFQNFEFRNCNF